MLNATPDFVISAQYYSKAIRTVPVRDEFALMISSWASLGLHPSEDIDFEEPFADSSSDEYDNSKSEDSKLPPPIPYFNRNARAPASATMLIHDICSRAKYSPITKMLEARAEKEIMH